MADNSKPFSESAEYLDAPGTLPPSMSYSQLEGTSFNTLVEYVEAQVAKRKRIKRAAKLKLWRKKFMSLLMLRNP